MFPARYPAPRANSIFSDEARYNRWRDVTNEYARVRIREMVDNPTHRTRLLSELSQAPNPTPTQVAEAEQALGHDVVAFLAVYTESLDPAIRPFIHFGLTSSDLVDNAHFQALRLHVASLTPAINVLAGGLYRYEAQSTPRVGRTHGQVADLTSWNHQMHVHSSVLKAINRQLREWAEDRIIKSAGPTGHSPLTYLADQAVAANSGHRVVPSTQVIPRDFQIAWASLYLRLACELEALATLIRCGARQEIGELREGVPRVGSSSMPTKKNPIDSEKVCGLARVARGYFTAITESVALWDDRDISNSSVERVAVPGLAACVEHMVDTMIRVMRDLEVDFARMWSNADNGYIMVGYMQTLAQDHFRLGPVEASALIREVYNPERNYIDGYKIRKRTGASREAVQAWADAVYALVSGVLSGGNVDMARPPGEETNPGGLVVGPPARQD